MEAGKVVNINIADLKKIIQFQLGVDLSKILIMGKGQFQIGRFTGVLQVVRHIVGHAHFRGHISAVRIADQHAQSLVVVVTQGYIHQGVFLVGYSSKIVEPGQADKDTAGFLTESNILI